MSSAYNSGDQDWILVRKILEALVGTTGSGGIAGAIGASTGVVTTQSDATVTAAGTAVLAIPAGKSGYILSKVEDKGNLYVGGSDVTNAGGSRQGLILLDGGLSPFLPGPVYVNSDQNNKGAGVITV